MVGRPVRAGRPHHHRAGDELTNDYATSTADPDFTMTCSCGSPLCRGVVTGDDWRRADLHERYGTHWVPALARTVRRRDPGVADAADAG